MSRKLTLLFLMLGICLLFLILVELENQQRRHWVYHAALGSRIPPNYSVHGIDVSEYQKTVNWDKIKALRSHDTRLSFAFIRATMGESGKDDRFAENWRKCKQAGIIRGAYHYFRPYYKPDEQAAHFLRAAKMTKGDLPPTLDVEITDKVSPALLRKRVRIWLEEVEKVVKVRPILYSNYQFYNDYLDGYFDDYPCWIAHYSAGRVNMRIGNSWTFWQYTDQGNISFIDHDIDLNVFQGSMEELKSLCID